MLPQDDVRAFARQADAASQRVRTTAASIFPNLDPRRLVLIGYHPCCGVAGVVGLFQIFLGTTDEVACRNGRSSGFGELLGQILRKCRRKLAHFEDCSF
jgi:hypothetical protein